METPPRKAKLIVVGGVEVEVKYLDDRTERVKVRQLAVKSMDRYLEVFGNEAEAIALFCERDQAWVESLTPESFDAIIEKIEELNLPLFRNWYRRLMARSEIMNPGLVKQAQETAAAAVDESVKSAIASASTTSARSSASDAD